MKTFHLRAAAVFASLFCCGVHAASDVSAYYAFDEASGTTVRDASGNGNTATLAGAVRTKGVTGNAVLFPGAGDQAQAPDSATLAINGSMSLEAWIKPSELPTIARPIILKGKTWPSNYSLSLERGALRWKWAGGSKYYYSSSTLQADVWQHVALTYDSGTKAVKFYINGALQGVDVENRAPTPVTGPLYIGSSEDGNCFPGAIDEVRIYKRALTAAEVKADMQLAAGFDGGFEKGLWPLEIKGNFMLDNTASHSGAYSVKISGSGTRQYMASDLISVNPGEVYALGVWVKSDFADSSTPVHIDVLQTGEGSQAISWYPSNEAALIKTGGWQNWTRYTATLDKLHPATTGVKIYLSIGAGAAGTVWFDDVSLNNINAIGSFGSEASWPFKSGQFTYAAPRRSTGNRAVFVTGGAAESWLSTGTIAIRSAEAYKLALWIKTDSVSSQNGISVNVLQVDGGGNALEWIQANGNYKLIQTGGTGDWKRYEISLSGFDQKTAFLKVFLRCDAGIGGSAWFDDVVLSQVHRDGFLWGVNGHSYFSSGYAYSRLDQQLNAAADLGVGLYRINITPAYYPGSGTYYWNYLDEVVNKAYERGMKIVLVFYDGAEGAESEVYLRQRAQDIAARYKGKIAYYQLSNETDIRCLNKYTVTDKEGIVHTYDYDGTQTWQYDPVRYAVIRDRLRGLSEGVRAGDATAKRIINMGWKHTGFLELLNADGVQWELTGFDWYWGTTGMLEVLNKIQSYPQPEILITESDLKDGTHSATESDQAEYVRRTANAVYYQAPSKVIGYVHYELIDELGSLALPPSEQYYGLLYYGNQGLTAKAGYYTYRDLIRSKNP